MVAANIKTRLERLEAANDTLDMRHTHFIQASAGGQSEEEVRAEVERVCRQRGIHDSADSMLIILRGVVKPGPNGPEYADRPITVSRIDGQWLV